MSPPTTTSSRHRPRSHTVADEQGPDAWSRAERFLAARYNRDGHADNHSNNWGVEGETDDAAVNATRAAVTRAMLATLFASAGTPMLLGGDEMARTQRGNNNAYCQDNDISWVDWARAAGPVIQRLSPLAVAMKPSREVASLRVTCGRPACRCMR